MTLTLPLALPLIVVVLDPLMLQRCHGPRLSHRRIRDQREYLSILLILDVQESLRVNVSKVLFGRWPGLNVSKVLFWRWAGSVGPSQCLTFLPLPLVLPLPLLHHPIAPLLPCFVPSLSAPSLLSLLVCLFLVGPVYAWAPLEQIARWRPYSVVSARRQMAPPPLVEEALLGVPLDDQWSCRVSMRGPESDDEKE